MFKNKYNKHFELVIENHKNDTFVTISIGELGGLTTSYTSGSEGEMKLFPNDQSLLSIMNDPSELDRFCKSFK